MGHSESSFHKPLHGAYVRSCRWLTGALPSKAAAASWSLTFLTSIGVGSKDATTPYYSCGARSKRRGIAGKAAVVRRYSRRLCPRLAQLTPEQRAIYPGAKTTFEPPASRRGAWWLLKQREELSHERRTFVEQLCHLCPEAKRIQEMAQGFRKNRSVGATWSIRSL